MNNQEFFNQTLNHLRVQGKRSYDSNQYDCMYRAPDGSMCAIGAHIPDSEYKKKMEGKNVDAVRLYYPSALWRVNGVSTVLLTNMQSLHDSYYHKLEDKALEIARTYGLTMPEYEWVRMDWVDYQYRTDLMDNPPKHVGYYEARRAGDETIFMVYWDGDRFRSAKNGHLITGAIVWRGLRSPAPTR